MIVGNLFKILLFFYLFNMNVSFLYTKQDRLRVQLSKFNKFVVIGKNECCDIINTWKQENIEDKEYRIMLDKGIRQICDNTAFPLFVNRTNAQYMIINLVSEENVNIINILDNKKNTWHIDKAIMDRLYGHLDKCTSRVLKVGGYLLQPHKAILSELRNSKEWSKALVANHFEIMFINLIRIFEGEISSTILTDDELRLMSVIENYILDNLKTEVSIFQLASLSGLSENYFRVQFKKITGMSPLKFINRKRIEAAKELLLIQHRPITEIAFELGFSSCQYFSTFFKKQTTLTPEEFRKEALRMLKSSVHKSVLAKDAAEQMDKFFQ